MKLMHCIFGHVLCLKTVNAQVVHSLFGHECMLMAKPIQKDKGSLCHRLQSLLLKVITKQQHTSLNMTQVYLLFHQIYC